MTEIEKAVKNLSSKFEELRKDSKKGSAASFYFFVFIVAIVVYFLWGKEWGGNLKIKDKILPTSSKINLISFSDTNLLIRTDKGEVKLLNPNTHKVQDVSLGDSHARDAALSSDGQTVAYVSTTPDGSALNFVSQEGKVTSIFDAEEFNKEAKFVFNSDTKTQICEWSHLFWYPEKSSLKTVSQSSVLSNPALNPNISTDGKKLAFFACNKNESILFVVTTAENRSSTKPIWRTKANSVEPRQAVWLADGKIAFTSGDSIGTLFLLDPNVDEEPTHLYGSLNNSTVNP